MGGKASKGPGESNEDIAVLLRSKNAGDTETINELANGYAFARACDTRVALRYAELRTAGVEDGNPDDLARFDQAFSGREQREIRAVVDLFIFTNRFNNTWEAAVSPPAAASSIQRHRWQQRRHGRQQQRHGRQQQRHGGQRRQRRQWRQWR